MVVDTLKTSITDYFHINTLPDISIDVIRQISQIRASSDTVTEDPGAVAQAFVHYYFNLYNHFPNQAATIPDRETRTHDFLAPLNLAKLTDSAKEALSAEIEVLKHQEFLTDFTNILTELYAIPTGWLLLPNVDAPTFHIANGTRQD
ncbi:Hypothetical predicted protein [Pelobates cultripes]|uniref:Uncharacterized protein n=1 Tax=Pelobates cultripes TaxID=61616 RepID=A0AAD1TJH4_PELCU|nr:Hypothetical predicted protein [Pelobates cultripes]